MATKIDTDVLDVLRDTECDGDLAVLQGTLDRSMYVRVNKVLEGLGGKWNRKRKGHVFAVDAAERIGDAVSSGEFIDDKKEFQFFETPRELACRMCDAVVLAGESVLEPSAGHGAIAVVAREQRAVVKCIELDPRKCDVLTGKDFAVDEADFLQVTPMPVFGHVLMNPPFTRSQDIAHVRHAYEFLRPGGKLAAIMATGWTFRMDKKAVTFREWLASVGGKSEALPPGTFRESGTLINTTLVSITR